MTAYQKVGFVASPTPEAEAALQELSARYGSAPLETADAIVALGGDGLMLQAAHRFMNTVPVSTRRPMRSGRCWKTRAWPSTP